MFFDTENTENGSDNGGEFKIWIFFDTEGFPSVLSVKKRCSSRTPMTLRKSYDHGGRNAAGMTKLGLGFNSVLSVKVNSVSKVFPVSSVSRDAHHAALIREIVRSLISVKPMSVPIFSPYPSFMFSMPSGSR